MNDIISPALSGLNPFDQECVDTALRELDGTSDKRHLGANALLSVSLATARAAANHYRVPLYRYLGGVGPYRLPVPMMNLINGGAHAAGGLDIQEFMILPVGAPTFAEALRWGSEIYRELGRLLAADGHSTSVGDEGGYAPRLESDEKALTYLLRAIEGAGYDSEGVKLALDAAASEWVVDGRSGEYILPKKGERLTRGVLIDRWEALCREYPILSIEDGLGEDDREGWVELTRRLGQKVRLVGDDLFVTSTSRLEEGMAEGMGNTILIKPNQIGTLTETLEVIGEARDGGYGYILSHRSGETEDTTLADLAVATAAPFIKAGAPCRSERVAKYNRLLRIEASLGR